MLFFSRRRARPREFQARDRSDLVVRRYEDIPAATTLEAGTRIYVTNDSEPNNPLSYLALGEPHSTATDIIEL